jgi:carboxyl-terminal processing protease
MLKNRLKIGTAIVALLALSSAAVMAADEVKSTAADTYKALNLFGDVFEQTRANYVEPVADKKLIEYALNGMLSSLDPHSGFMNEEEAKSMNIQNKGEFGGLGIEVTMENNVVKVVSPIDDTPAARAGVQAGDLIVEIDGKPVMGMTLNDSVDKMRGKVGTEITLTIVRQGNKAPLKVKLVRDIIQIQSVKFRVENGNTGYIRITTFNAQTYPPAAAMPRTRIATTPPPAISPTACRSWPSSTAVPLPRPRSLRARCRTTSAASSSVPSPSARVPSRRCSTHLAAA